MLGVVRDLRSPRSLADPSAAADYQEHLLAEFVLARLAHGVADSTIRGELAAVEEFLASAGVWAWEVEPATPTGSSATTNMAGPTTPVAARPAPSTSSTGFWSCATAASCTS